MKTLFLNDTSTGHAGSVAASQSILGALRRSGFDVVYRHHVGSQRLPVGLFDNLSKARGAVVCHGEGTLHGDAPRALWLIARLRSFVGAGLRVCLVNALCDRGMVKALPALHLASWREPRSFSHGKGVQTKLRYLLADSCADPRVWEGGEPLCELPPVVRGFTHPASKCAHVLDKHDYVRFGLHSAFRDVVATLRTCKVYLTGQHHGVYAAGLAGIPFVPIPSNSHKIEALIRWSGLGIPIARTAKKVKELIPWAMKRPGLYRRFHEWLVSLPYLNEEHLLPILRQSS